MALKVLENFVVDVDSSATDESAVSTAATVDVGSSIVLITTVGELVESLCVVYVSLDELKLVC